MDTKDLKAVKTQTEELLRIAINGVVRAFTDETGLGVSSVSVNFIEVSSHFDPYKEHKLVNVEIRVNV